MSGMRIFLFGCLICGVALSNGAFAQETAPGDACTAGETDYIRQVGGPETSGEIRILRCNGTTWDLNMVIDSNGNVGIGVDSTPGNPLHVRRKASNEVANIFVQNSNVSNSTAGIAFGTSGPGDQSAPTALEGANFHGGRVAVLRTNIDEDGVVENGFHYMNFQVSKNAILNTKMVLSSNGRLGIGTNTPAATLDVAGDIYYTGILRDQSDRSVKDDIRPIGAALEKLKRIKGVSFVMKDDPKRQREIGVIAQDVQAVYPDLVSAGSDGILGLNYQGLIAPLIEAVKELDAQNDDLKAENTELRRMVHELTARMDVIEGKRRPLLKPYNQ